uniref:Anopheles gambiae putative tubulin alpha chain n=1 Tax=Anopheles gambiae TaxID=7165 RepID=Q17014_ANOGA|nr:putative tubulin alpha chain [Anopheles gambiae]
MRECISVHVGQAGVQIGNPCWDCTVWSMASNRTVRCPRTRRSEAVMTRSTPSSPRLAQASTCPVPCSSIWSRPSSMRCAPARTASCSTRSS